MCDVFTRLYENSTSHRPKAERKVRDSIRKEETEKWKLTLAANCYLVDRNDAPQAENLEVISSLNSISLHRKRPRTSSTKNRKNPVLNENRRTVSTIMDRKGSVVCVDNYIITDSVEPTPYAICKPEEPLSARRFYQPTVTPKSPRFNTEKYKSQIQMTKPKQIQWAPTEHITVTNLNVQTDKNLKKAGPKSGIMVDIDHVEDINEEIPKPTPLISSTGTTWDNYGFPLSVSSILDPI
ncbi:hypothetical protein TVAG_351830 [Trichomonas vaginalis G3]|uniref:Uncharacterized protein n=1 Tax=Trichomonas vaginalis (strain ATCC PRA-98 / G3) TaxID=412133 RepID=A2DZR7_TRIV3|nr:hypothetical protein TVAGG3_0261400 [Trichomonas vaginalis G3]EAY14135.1 hypothetical protein TVAG_351830 [Trichomonas vaginalis G3]KAI5525145.1 hypothetical protein TVAGG3_0261400 [Trichomonas vaginalis G3]|eukprot:XP_001326358.1 hypothetical protein [Trichomonas vaginalis G3]